MIFWQHSASQHLGRLSERLAKYQGGQILLNTKMGIFRGPINNFTVVGEQIKFDLLWLAKKRVISKPLCMKWKWEMTHEQVRNVECKITIELRTGTEKGPAEGPTEMQAEVPVKKFYQNKQGKRWWWWGVVYPKCLFFSTSIAGERGVLFQPNDPRNLQLVGEVIIDPFAPTP